MNVIRSLCLFKIVYFCCEQKGTSINYVCFCFKKAMFFRNPRQNIRKKEIASLYLSDKSLGETDSIRIAVKFQLRDTSAYLL